MTRARMTAPALVRTTLLAVVATTGSALAQSYPSKPIRFVVPFAPGGTTDILARLIAQRLAEPIGQTVVIDNRPGANGALGSEIVAKSPPDGHTIIMGYLGSLGINPNLYAKLPYDAIRDFAPITLAASTTQAIASHPSLPARNARDLIDLARSRPGQITYASAGIGAPSHLAGELFKSMAKIDMVHIPYKGSGAALADLLGGHVAISFGGLAAVAPQVKAGRLRVLAVANAKRSPGYPDIPTVAEAGLPGYEVQSWFGVLAPAGTPREIVQRLHTEIVRILTAQDVKGRLAGDGAEVVANTPEQFAAYIRAEIAKWGKVIRDARIRPD
jgi:tripartite-type tricarboxylate transporter receptor subunit TctC